MSKETNLTVRRGRPRNPDLPPKALRSFRLDLDLYLRCQAACYKLRKVYTQEMETLMRRWVEEQEARYNQGEPFPIPDEPEFEAIQEQIRAIRAAREE